MPKIFKTIYAVPSVSANGYTMTVQPLQDGVLFERNKPIQFEVVLTKDGKPCSDGDLYAYFKWNSRQMIYRQDLKLVNGRANINFTCEQSGFGNLHVLYYRNDVEIFEQLRGIAISPDLLKRSYPCPEDFDNFWKSKLEKINKPFTANYTKIDKTTHPHLHETTHKSLLSKDLTQVDIQDVQVTCLENGVSGILTRPKNPKPKSLAAVLFLHGAGVSACDPSLFIDQAKRGVMVYDINAHGIPNDKPKSWYDELKNNGALKDYQTFGRNDKNEFYYLNMYLRVKRGLDFLMSLPEWDGKVLVTMGGSQGCAQSMAGAYLEEKVTAVVGKIPAYGDLTGFLVGRDVNFNDWLKMEPRGRIPKGVLDVAPYFDNVNFLRNYKREALFCFGLLDQGCLPTTNYVPVSECPANATVLLQSDVYHSVCKEAEDICWEFVYQHMANLHGAK